MDFKGHPHGSWLPTAKAFGASCYGLDVLAGWWLTYPSEKYDFVSWDDDIPNIYICEQNDPCSGCYPKSFQEHLAFVFSSVSMAATEERLVFLEMGA